MWKKTLLASSNTALSPSTNSWDEHSNCSIESNKLHSNKDSLMSPSSRVSQSDDIDSAEGIWSADIEQAFIEAMAIYPPCGRRKIILSEEGKMYGRNELIARYIKLRTGKTRTRKQVSSHIQVLGRRHAKFISAAAFKFQAFKDHPYFPINSPAELSADLKSYHTPLKNEKEVETTQSHFETPTKATPSSIIRNLSTPLKSSSSFNSNERPHEAQPIKQAADLDRNNNNSHNHVEKYPLENCATQFYPDSTFSPTSNNSTFPLSYNNPSFGPNPSQPVRPQSNCHLHRYDVQPYNNNPYDFRSSIHLASTPPSCYARPPQAHMYSPHIGQTWTDTVNTNRYPGTPEHPCITPSTDLDRNNLTPCHPRNLTISSQLRCIESNKLKLIEFSAYAEKPSSDRRVPYVHNFLKIDDSSYDNTEFEAIDINKILDKFPSSKGGLLELFEKGPRDGFYLVKFWTNLSVNLENASEIFFGSTARFESQVFCSEIQSSTKVCSFGRQVVERVEKESSTTNGKKFIFEFLRSPMCDYLVNFVYKLNQLPERSMMNSVLENFSVLQVVTSVETKETLLCLGYVFEVSESESETQHCIYRLV